MDATNKMIEPMNLALLASEAALQRSYDLENLIENDLQVIYHLLHQFPPRIMILI